MFDVDRDIVIFNYFWRKKVHQVLPICTSSGYQIVYAMIAEEQGFHVVVPFLKQKYLFKLCKSLHGKNLLVGGMGRGNHQERLLATVGTSQKPLSRKSGLII